MSFLGRLSLGIMRDCFIKVFRPVSGAMIRSVSRMVAGRMVNVSGCVMSALPSDSMTKHLPFRQECKAYSASNSFWSAWQVSRARALSALVALTCVLSIAGAAHAQGGTREVVELNRGAMDAYTELDVKRARSMLRKALKLCERGDVDKAQVARTHANLGIVYAGGMQDNSAALDAFELALRADPGVRLDPLLSSPDITNLFNLARRRAGTGAAPAYDDDDDDDLLSFGSATPAAVPPTGGGAAGRLFSGPGNIPHMPVPEQLDRTALPVFIEAPEDAPVGAVYVYYRNESMGAYAQVPMQRVPGGFGVLIPCKDVAQPRMSYYISAFSRSKEPLGFAGTATEPVTVPIVGSRSQPAPALPGGQPPEQCAGTGSAGNCVAGMPGCESESPFGGAAGNACESENDCYEGESCVDGMCRVAGASSDAGSFPKFFLHVGGVIGAGIVRPGMRASSVPSSPASATSFEPSGGANCNLASSSEQCVAVDGTGLVPTFALNMAFGYYFYKSFGAALSVRYQFDAEGRGIPNFLIGGRLQYLFTERKATGFNAAALIGTSFGQIQLRPPQPEGQDRPTTITGLNGIQAGAVLGYRFYRNFGVQVTPVMHFLFPDSLIAFDLNAGVEVAF